MHTSTVEDDESVVAVVLVVAAVEENAPATQRLHKSRTEIASDEERIRLIIFEVQLRFIIAYHSDREAFKPNAIPKKRDEEKLNLSQFVF